MFVTIRFSPIAVEVGTDDLGVDETESAADIVHKGKISVPAASFLIRMEPIEENTTDTSRFVSVFQEEILVAPLLVARVVRDPMSLTDDLHGAMKKLTVGLCLCATPVEHRSEIRPATESVAGGDHHARIHVDHRHVRIDRMRDQRDA